MPYISDEMKKNIKVKRLQIKLTKSSFAQQGESVFQSRTFPPSLLEILTEQLRRGFLLAVPVRHAPESLYDVFLPKDEVEKRTVDGVALLCLDILVPSDDFKLGFLNKQAHSNWSVFVFCFIGGSRGYYQRRRVSKPHEHPAFLGILPEQSTVIVLSRSEIRQNLVAVAVLRPYNLSP